MKQFVWELHLLARNRAFLILILIYTTAACLAIFAGHQRQQQQSLHNERAEARYQAEIEKWRSSGDELDAGYVGYYQFLPTKPNPSPLAALFPGERPEHNWNLPVRLLALYGQLYAGEIQHYDNWIPGRFDLGFVWTYLLPIVIGLMCVNTIADEKTSGRWPLLRAQVRSARHFLVSRLKVYFVILALLNIGLFSLAAVSVQVPVGATWSVITVLLLIYQLFWFCVVAFIARVERNTIFNVLSYCCIWLVSALLVPGMHYISQMNDQELNLGIAILMEQRQQMNDSWDRNKNADFAEFLEQNPEWNDTGPLPEVFHWKWYYAMQSISDAAVEEYVDQLRSLRLDSYQSASFWAWASPVMSLQHSFSAIAGTDGAAHQHYVDQVQRFHKKMKSFFYPHYFFDRPFPKENLKDIPQFHHEEPQRNLAQGFSQLLSATAVLLLLMSLQPLLSSMRDGSRPALNNKTRGPRGLHRPSVSAEP